MLYWILVIIYLIFGYLILLNTGIKRLLYYYLGILYIPAALSIIPQSMLMGHYFYVSAFILSMLRYREFSMRNFLSSPLSNILLIVFLSYLLIGLFDSRVSTPLGIYRAVYHFCGTYFPFFIGWVSFSNDGRDLQNIGFIKEGNSDDSSIFFKLLLPATIIMTLYGVTTAFTHTNPVLDSVGLKDRFLMDGDYGFRSFRVSSACISSSVYGLVCATLGLTSMFLIKDKTKIQIFAICMLLLNVFLTATRAAIIPSIIGFIIFIILDKGVSGVIKYILLGIAALLFIFPLLPDTITNYMIELTDSIFDVILPSGTGGEKYGGSNLNARSMQIAAAMEFLKEKPLFGHGFGYFGEVLFQGDSHLELLGMESYLCFMGVERGIVNLIAECLFYISGFIYFFKHRSLNKLYADVGIALLAMFIPFLVFAWVGGCWFFFMPILGYLVKVIDSENKSFQF